jgi:hypothetical protein
LVYRCFSEWRPLGIFCSTSMHNLRWRSIFFVHLPILGQCRNPVFSFRASPPLTLQMFLLQLHIFLNKSSVVLNQ